MRDFEESAAAGSNERDGRLVRPTPVRRCRPLRPIRSSLRLAIATPSLLFLTCVAAAAPALQIDLSSRTGWTFHPGLSTGAHATVMRVPFGGWTLNGFPAATAGVYERRITVPRLGAGAQATTIAFDEVNWEAVVSIGPDARHLSLAGRHLSPFTPFAIDLTRFVKPGASALLRVAVRDRSWFRDTSGRFTVPAGEAGVDRVGRGILRGVWLRVYPAVSVRDVYVRPSTADNTLRWQVTVANVSAIPQRVRLVSTLAAATAGSFWRYPELPGWSGAAPAHGRLTVSLGPVRWTPGSASWWWPNVPYRAGYFAQLHTLSVRLIAAAGAAAAGESNVAAVKFGFCSAGQRGSVYTLNGVPFRLRGDNLAEQEIAADAFSRLPGFLLPGGGNAGWPGAVRSYQRLNYDIVRMHNCTATPYMLDVCDRLGLLVMPETGIDGAGGVLASPADPDAYAVHLRELVLSERNHACVFKWSLANEVRGQDALVAQLYAACRAADPSRPCSVDGAPDVPRWPSCTRIEHFSEGRGVPERIGGKRRGDRPYGQGAYVWPAGSLPSGSVWFALSTRALREQGDADLRPSSLIDVWPGVVPGLTRKALPAPVPVSGPLSRVALVPPAIADPWQDWRIQLIQRSFAPLAVYDPDFDLGNLASNGHGEWPTAPPQIPAGRPLDRRVLVFNDTFKRADLRLRVETFVITGRSGRRPAGAIERSVSLQPAVSAAVPLHIPVPQADRNAYLEVDLVLRDGAGERYREPDAYVVIAAGATRARLEGVDASTGGDWSAGYGQEAFAVPIVLGKSASQLPGISIDRGLGGENRNERPWFLDDPRYDEQAANLDLDKVEYVEDRRVPVDAPGGRRRQPVAFLSPQGPLFVRATTSDGKPHRLSLYLLDYKRTGEVEDVDVYDAAGHLLSSRCVDHYEPGIYLRYRFTGSVIVSVRSLTLDPTTLCGVFVDPDTGDELLPSRTVIGSTETTRPQLPAARK